jgi:hypothetical protein
VVLGGIVAFAFAQRAFDRWYYEPICRRYGEARQMEFVSVLGGGRRDGLRCVFNLYYADGAYQATVDVPVSRATATPAEYWLGNARWLIALVLLAPMVWVGRKLSGGDDDDHRGDRARRVYSRRDDDDD